MSISRITVVLVGLTLAGCGRGPDDRAPDRAAARAGSEPVHAAGVVAPSTAVEAPSRGPCGEPSADCGCDGKRDAPAGAANVRETVRLDGAPMLGPRDAPVTLVVFSDFECPFCAKVEPRILALAERYRGQVRVAFKNQPLPMHDRARLAAKAALAADEQGKFWELHSAIFASRALDRESLEASAEKLGLDLPRFRAAMDGDDVERRIAADVVEAHRLDVKGTPTFFVNGRRIVGAQPNDVFAAAIDEELALAGVRPVVR